ncbi:MAG: acetyl-CoA C-acetyltransferase [Actinomycetota bacterium]|nr:acetyl-CoA C-acetyltransferase [Actinomycetota bacterium]
MSPSATVIAARRTPVTTAGRALAAVGAADLAAPVLAALDADVARLLGAPGRSGATEVVLGNCRGPGGNVARVAALAAGLGEATPGLTVDRQCGSGLEAVRLGTLLAATGAADVVLAGGTESASLAPGGTAHRAPFAPPGADDPGMGEAADTVARERSVTRERQDAYAERSHARMLAARAAGAFDAELVPVGGVDRDDRPRPLAAGRLARLRPAFSPTGTVTAGNACGVSDGAAAVALVPDDARRRAGIPGLRILASAVTGGDPARPALAAAPAVRAVLATAGVPLGEVAVIEVTEAFAAQVLVFGDDLGLDPLGADAERVCPDGGAVALGHPWSASGALLVVRLFSRLVRRPAAGRYGIAACAIGGGQGLAVLTERVVR